MEDCLLSLRHIVKSFGEGNVLDDISLNVQRGEFVTLLGASGCGKTTTLRVISGLETPDEGQVVLDGRDVTLLPPESRPVNTVFQSYALFPHMSVEKNVAYGLRVRGMDKKLIAERVGEMLELVQMQEYRRRMPAQLSGGQRQRIAIARALAPEPELLLLDEPLGALDLQLRRQMQLELKRLQKKLGVTFIYITHDQEEAVSMSDRIAIMRGGRFEQVGTPEEIYDAPQTRYVAQFIGRSTILDGTVERVDGSMAVVRNANGCFAVDAGRASLRAGETLELCVRTERMRASREPVDGFDLPGTVRETRYAGGSVLTYVVLADGTEVVASGEERMADAPQPGMRVCLHWDAAQAAVIGGASHGA